MRFQFEKEPHAHMSANLIKMLITSCQECKCAQENINVLFKNK